MLQKTRGIVINSFKYGENSLISRIYTEEHGLLSFIAHGAGSKRSNKKHNIFQPLNCIELVYKFKNTGNLQTIREIRLIKQHKSISFDIIKVSVALFISEVLKCCLKEQEKNPPLFDYLLKSINLLDRTKNLSPAFHLVFMVELSAFLGFSPRNNYDKTNRIFDLYEGIYQHSSYVSSYSLTESESEAFFKLQNTSLKDAAELEINAAMRKKLLYRLIEFYRLHVEGFKELISHKILEEVLH